MTAVARIKVLHDTKARLLRDMKLMNKQASNEGRDFTDPELTRYTAMDVELASLNGELQAEERKADAEREQAGTGVTRHAGAPEGDDDDGPTPVALPSRAQRPRVGGKYAELFGIDPRGQTDGFRSFDDYLMAVASDKVDPRLRPIFERSAPGAGGMATHQNEPPTSGGFFTPVEHAARLLDSALESEVVRPRATIEPMKSESKKITSFDVSDSTVGPYGIAAQWLAESGAITLKDFKTRQIELIAKKLGLLADASSELVADGESFEDQLQAAMIAACAYNLDLAYLTGSGGGRPLGVKNDPALIVVPKETTPAQPVDTFLYENAVKMMARLHPACWERAVWVVHPSVVPFLLNMNIRVQNAAGTEFVGGSAVPVLSQDGNKMRLLSREVVVSEKMSSIGDQFDVVLADFSNYIVGMRKEVSMAKSIHPGFATDKITFRTIVRTDGHGAWAQAYKPKVGSTLSWCVTLEAR